MGVTLQSIVQAFRGVLDDFALAVVAVAFLVFVWGIVEFIFNIGNYENADKSREAGKKKMIWGVAGLFLIVSVWGIVSIISTTLGVDPIDIKPTPIINM